MPGYKVETVKPLKSYMICPHCGLMLRCAIQTDEGIRLCKSCFEEIASEQDGTRQKSGTSEQFHEDRATQKEILTVQVKCNFSGHGCPWEGHLIYLKEHCEDCHYMYKLVRQCQYCHEDFLATEVEEHCTACLKYFVSCDNCQTLVHQDKLFEHEGRLGSCYAEEQTTGGGNLIIRDEDPDLESDSMAHSPLQDNEVEEKASKAKIAADIAVKKSFHAQQQVTELEEILEQMEQQPECSISALQQAEIDTKSIIESRKDEGRDKEMALMTREVAQMKKEMAQMKKEMARMMRELERIKSPLSDQLITRSPDGSFLWKITEVSFKRKDAVEERISSIDSPPFYTERDGYKLCIRVYLNGNGIGYKTHLSVFIVIMKGEYDPLLSWPFKGKISFVLVDQNKKNYHFRTFVIKPTLLNRSIQRPHTPPEPEMNPGVGRPKFAELSVLKDKNYVNENSMYIKCVADVS